MNKKRTFITGIVAGLMIAMVFLTPASASKNILENGDFSDGNGQSSVKGWNVQTFAGSGTLKHVVDDDKDAPYVTLTTNEESDFRLIQTIQAKPNTTYKFSGKIKTDGIKNKNNTGAILSVTYSQSFTDSVYNTKGKWKYVEMYIMTNTQKTFFDISIGIGGHSSLNSGTASFKDLKLEVCKNKVPATATVCDIDKEFAPAATNSKTSVTNSNSKWLLIIVILIVGGIIIYLLLFSGKKPDEEKTKQETNTTAVEQAAVVDEDVKITEESTSEETKE